jgi:hypothetical protein
MLTVEYRVNGQLIGCTHIHNKGMLPEYEGRFVYDYAHHSEDGCCNGSILHDRKDGFEVLVKKVIVDRLKKAPAEGENGD